MALAEEEYDAMAKDFENFEIQVLLSHEYDQNNAILELHPGAGGTESCDWASMLYRMYTRYAEKKGFKVTVLDYQPGEEAGIKSVTFLVEGDKAYGYLKGEKGVHRLVRISPFDSGARRHTSFASLDVMPQFNDEIEIEVKPEDLIIETKEHLVLEVSILTKRTQLFVSYISQLVLFQLAKMEGRSTKTAKKRCVS